MKHDETRVSAGPARGRLLLAAAIILAGLILSSLAFAGSRAAPPVPPMPRPTADDITATVSVFQEDDVFDLSPGLDYHARMSWASTGEKGKRTPIVTSLSGTGNFTANAEATLLYPTGTACGNPRYSMTASGKVEPLGNLQFSFVPKDVQHPARGLKGWSVFTPITQWKGTMQIEKVAPCTNGSEAAGSTFDGLSMVGGTKIGGTKIAAPRVAVTASGTVTISGGATVITPSTGTVRKRQAVRFSITCSRAAICFGRPDDGSEGLEHSSKFLGATCEKGPSGTVRMRVKMRMMVFNGDGVSNWAQGMRAQVRLVPTSAGLNFHRDWQTQYTGSLVQGHRYSQDFEIVTDTVSPTKDWVLEFKYTWDRNGKRDVVEQVKGKTPIPCR